MIERLSAFQAPRFIRVGVDRDMKAGARNGMTDNIHSNQSGFSDLVILSILIFPVSNGCAAAEIRHRFDTRFFAGFFAKAIPLRRATMPVIPDS